MCFEKGHGLVNSSGQGFSLRDVQMGLLLSWETEALRGCDL